MSHALHQILVLLTECVLHRTSSHFAVVGASSNRSKYGNKVRDGDLMNATGIQHRPRSYRSSGGTKHGTCSSLPLIPKKLRLSPSTLSNRYKTYPRPLLPLFPSSPHPKLVSQSLTRWINSRSHTLGYSRALRTKRWSKRSRS